MVKIYDLTIINKHVVSYVKYSITTNKTHEELYYYLT